MFECRGEFVGDADGVIESAVGAAVGSGPGLQLREPDSGLNACFLVKFLCVDEVVAVENAALGLVVVEFVEQEFDLTFADGQSEVICGDGFDGVGFIEDDGFVIRQDAGTIATECEVREEECVIDDQQIGIPDSSAGGVVEAVGVGGTFLSQAVTVITVDFVPDVHGWLERQIGTTAIAGLSGPLLDA